MRMLVRCCFFTLLFLASVATWADTISLIPASPNSTTPITLQIDGTSPNSSPASLLTLSIQGQVIRVEGCFGIGFANPSDYRLLVPIGTLSAGNYTAEYYIASVAGCSPGGVVLHPPELRATLSFAVLIAALVTPTLQSGALAILALMLALMFFLRVRRSKQ